MNRRDRRLLRHTFALGLLLVAFVALMDLAGGWSALENAMSDWRTRHFQNFVPKPTDALVHIDIDDPSLELIGKWPWPRHVFASMLDELHGAGVKAAAFDVIFPEAGEGDDDAVFAAALARFGKAIVPISFAPRAPDPRYTKSQKAAVDLLTFNPAMTLAELSQRLSQNQLQAPDSQQYLVLLRRTISSWVKGKLAAGDVSLDELKSQLAGSGSSAVTVAMHLVEHEFKLQSALREIDRLGAPVSQSSVSLLEVDSIVPPLGNLERGAGHTAFVDDLLSQEFLRSLPIYAQRQGKTYGLLGFMLALEYFDVDPASVRIDRDRVTIPMADGPLSVPIYTESTRFGTVPAVMDLPWFGRPGPGNWPTAYDVPAHEKTTQHMPASDLYDPILTRHRIEQDNAQVDDAIAAVLFTLNADHARADQYLATRPSAGDTQTRLAMVNDLVKQAIDLVGDPSTINQQNLSPDEKKVVQSVQALQDYRREAASLSAQLVEQESALFKALKGKAVLIGSTASAAADVRVTPLWEETPGVLVHGAVFNAVLSRFFLHRAPWWANLLITLIVGVIVARVASHMPPQKAAMITLALLVSFLFSDCLLAYDWSHWIFELAPVTIICLLLPAVLSVARFIVERAERARIRHRFSSYLDPAILEYVEDNPHIHRFEGQLKTVSVVFTDLAGFTELTEKLQERTVGVLNKYLHLMTGIIRHRRGVVDKFLGDGIMFFYGAPRENATHAIDAVDTVLHMQEAMSAFNDDLVKSDLPAIGMRAGITSGEVIVGDAGGDRACNYTVLGDRVNLAARLESANKQFGTRALITDETAALLKDEFLLRPIGIISVKGKANAVRTYEPLARKGQAPDAMVHLAEATSVMVEAFIAGNFNASLEAADVLESNFGQEKLVRVYRENAKAHLVHKPVEFCGAIVLSEK